MSEYEPARDFGDEQSRLEAEETGKRKPKRAKPKPMPGPVALSEADLADIWVAQRGRDWRYRPGAGWVRWVAGEGWVVDDVEHVFSEIADLGRRVYARRGEDGPKPDPRAGGATRTARGAAVQAQGRLRAVGWDEDPELLGLPGGKVAELRSGRIRDRTRDDLVTRQAGALPAEAWNADCAWARLLSQAVPEDALPWFQRFAGYALTGQTQEHLLLFAYGPAGSGKGSVLTALANAFGSYARRIDPADLMERKGDQHPAWLADLDGRRLVIGDELPRGARWATGRVKGLVSGEPIRARRMRQDFFEFRPVAQVLLAGNHAPQMASADTGMRRRLRVLPMEHQPERPDPNIRADIDSGLWSPDVLRWLIDGVGLYMAGGLGEAGASVFAATESYAVEADILGEFLALPGMGVETQAATYIRYRGWAEERGHRPMSARSLSATLREDYGYGVERSHGQKYWRAPGD